MIMFKDNTTLSVIETRVIETRWYDTDNCNITEGSDRTFKAGEKIEANVFDDDGDYVDLQFKNGSMSLCVERQMFEIIRQEDIWSD